jgi:hypothetical protein
MTTTIVDEFTLVEDKCPDCGQELKVGYWWVCGAHEPVRPKPSFKPFDYDDGSGKVQTISSIQDASRIEQATMKAYKNGEGAPIVFRAFHQDQSNYDKQTLSGYESKPLVKDPRIKFSSGDRARDREVHPAVRRIRGE